MAAEPGSVQFSIGRVIGDSLGVYARNFVSFSVLALVIGVLNLLVSMYGLSQIPQATSAEMPELQMPDLSVVVFGALVTMLVSALTQAAIIYGTFQDLRGSRASFTDCISRGLVSVIPVIVGSIILSIGIMIGSILLIVPGIILALMWWVYVPAIVVEGKGIMESFGRSRELTRGHRWHILGLVIVILVLILAVGWIVDKIVGGIISASVDPAFFQIIAGYVVNSLIAAFGAILVAVGYYYLRAEKEGVDANEIANVFD